MSPRSTIPPWAELLLMVLGFAGIGFIVAARFGGAL